MRFAIAGGRRFQLWVLPWCVFALWVAGCDDDECGHEGPGNPSGDGGTLRVEIGTRGGAGQLDFIPLEYGGDIPLETFGQGGTHATVAVRAFGLGTNRAFIDVTVENVGSGAEAATVPSRRPQLWLCDDDRAVCDMLPVNVMTGGLAAPEEKDGLRVRVSAFVTTEDGRRGSGSQEGVLRKAFDGPIDAPADAGAIADDAGSE